MLQAFEPVAFIRVSLFDACRLLYCLHAPCEQVRLYQKALVYQVLLPQCSEVMCVGYTANRMVYSLIFALFQGLKGHVIIHGQINNSGE